MVLRHLGQMCDEFNPEIMFSGVAGEKNSEIFVAGQAVASALFDLVGDGSCVVYNDIDAFVLTNGSRLETRNKRLRLATLDYEVIEPFQSQYGALVASATSIYAVHSTERDGMLNTVLARAEVNFRKKNRTSFGSVSQIF